MILLFIHTSIQNKKEIYVTPLFKPILIYVALAAFSTCIGIIMGWIIPAMAFFFYLKEIEYFLIFIVVANFVKTHNELKISIYFLLMCAIANGTYILYQIFSGNFAGMEMGAYGIGTLGDPAAFPTGGYISMKFLLSIAVFSFIRGRTMKLISIVSLVICGIGLLGSGSRANTLGVVFSSCILLCFLLWESFKTKSIGLAYILLTLLGTCIIFNYAFNYLVEKSPALVRIRDTKHMKQSFFETRVIEIYIPVLKLASKSPIIGLGKTATTTVIGGTGEAHNFYIRIIAEMGIFGVISFLYILLSIIRMSLKLIRNSSTYFLKATGFACLLCTSSLIIASIGQDAFLGVKTNEIFWTIVGLTASAYNIDLEKNLEVDFETQAEK
jgi:O-antigen ligase